jgi:DNA polymerase elongation subunit (family B)
MARKVLLNALYGALTNVGSRFCDKRIGQSTTLTGRQITKHMLSKINEVLLGEYSHDGESIKYGDSVTGDAMIRINDGTQIRIDTLFDSLKKKVITQDGKAYAVITDETNGLGEPIQVLGYNSKKNQAEFGDIFHVMKHLTTKQKWQIETEDGNSVVVTNDHSIIIDRNGSIIEVKPSEILDDDLLICVKSQ